MDEKEIEELALRFRRGIDKACEKNLFRTQPFMDFPNACCGDAPDLLTQYFVENCANKKRQYRYVYGVYRLDKYQNIFGHAWLEIDHHIIVDITSDQRQFRNGGSISSGCIYAMLCWGVK